VLELVWTVDPIRVSGRGCGGANVMPEIGKGAGGVPPIAYSGSAGELASGSATKFHAIKVNVELVIS
jgi:hypothetical protein